MDGGIVSGILLIHKIFFEMNIIWRHHRHELQVLYRQYCLHWIVFLVVAIIC